MASTYTWFGILLILLGIVGYNLPLGNTAADPNTTLTIPVAAGICNSAMGQLGQAYSGEAAKTCSEWNNLLYGIYGSVPLGIILIIVGVVKPSKSEEEEDSNSLEILKDRYAKGEITKEEFDKMKKDLE